MVRPDDRQKFRPRWWTTIFFCNWYAHFQIMDGENIPPSSRILFRNFHVQKLVNEASSILVFFIFLCFWLANSLTTIRVPAGRGNSRSIGFARRNMYQIKASPIEYSNMLERSEVSSLKRRF